MTDDEESPEPTKKIRPSPILLKKVAAIGKINLLAQLAMLLRLMCSLQDEWRKDSNVKTKKHKLTL